MALTVKLSGEVEEAIERVFSDAIAPAADPNPSYDGRFKDDIEDDIELIRDALDLVI